MDSIHLKRQNLITKVADRLSVEAQTKELWRNFYLSQRKAVLENQCTVTQF